MQNESRQADADILITPEMIEAGVYAYIDFEEGDGSTASEIVIAIFRAMFSKRAR